MKIHVTGDGKNIHLSLPDWLIFGKMTVWLAGKAGGKYIPEGIATRDMHILLNELQKAKRIYGSWVLVEMESADGEHVKVEL